MTKERSDKGRSRVPLSEFLQRSTAIFGGKYDYSEVSYVSLDDTVTIGCPVHGKFQQKARLHLTSRGCKACANDSMKVGLDDFIQRSREIHGDKYDYSLVEYKNSCRKIAITCRLHGVFYQTPHGHLQGWGCAKCGRSGQLVTKEMFIERANEVHGNAYDYSNVSYSSLKDRVKIICMIHGEFTQTATDHLRGNGCRKCNTPKGPRKTTEQWIEKAKKRHGDKYSYERSVYTGSSGLVTITCKSHGDFQQIASYHISGNGCKECMLDAKRSDASRFIEKAIAIHGDIYDYSKVEYERAHQSVLIICPTHGEFSQTPNHHMKGKGCPACSNSHGERMIRVFLESHSIDYVAQWTTSECRSVLPLKFDFYIPSMNVLIEFDGQQHTMPCEMFGGEEALKGVIERDRIKDGYAAKSGKRLIRIPYTKMKRIDSILHRELNL